MKETEFKQYDETIHTWSNKLGEKTTQPTMYASFGMFHIQADPEFADDSITGGVVELLVTYSNDPSEIPQRLAVVEGTADRKIGEYLWIGKNHNDGEGSEIFAVSTKNTADGSWNVDLFEILDSEPWFALSRKDLLTNLSQTQIQSLSFNAGSFMWIADGQGKQLKLCAYTQSYDKATNSCQPCVNPQDPSLKVFGTFMVQ
jgi:hypothetical protein